jgi:hypothetical protein
MANLSSNQDFELRDFGKFGKHSGLSCIEEVCPQGSVIMNLDNMPCQEVQNLIAMHNKTNYSRGGDGHIGVTQELLQGVYLLQAFEPGKKHDSTPVCVSHYLPFSNPELFLFENGITDYINKDMFWKYFRGFNEEDFRTKGEAFVTSCDFQKLLESLRRKYEYSAVTEAYQLRLSTDLGRNTHILLAIVELTKANQQTIRIAGHPTANLD